jgi:outer membrane lipoprotein-sorting protein
VTVSRRALRWGAPALAAGLTAAGALLATAPGASGSEHPPLPARTAAQLLADLHGLDPAPFHGTVVETARLGLPSLPTGDLRGMAGSSAGSLSDLLTMMSGSHTAQVAYGGPDQQRVAVFTGESTETDVVHNGTDVWMYRSNDNSVTHWKLKPGDHADTAPTGPVLTPQQAAEKALAAISPSTKVAVDQTASVAGRPAYQITLAPKDSRSTISSVRIAVDNATKLPLRVQVWGSATQAPALEIGYTEFDTSPPGARTFEFDVPAGATVDQAGATKPGEKRSAPGMSDLKVVGSDWTAVGVTALPTGKQGGGVAGLLQEMGKPTAQGTLVHTALLNVLVAPDGRVAFGAVTPAVLAGALG